MMPYFTIPSQRIQGYYTRQLQYARNAFLVKTLTVLSIASALLARLCL
jgi:hypothetical protein